MRKFLKTSLGVTLLEVLLVLVIASLVLVMSIRYYQTASTQAKVNAGMETLSGVMASVDSYIAAGNGLSSITASGTSAGNLSSYLPNGALPQSPFGAGQVQFTTGATNYTITFPNVPDAGCSLFKSIATQNNKVTSSSGCTGNGNLAFVVTP